MRILPKLLLIENKKITNNQYKALINFGYTEKYISTLDRNEASEIISSKIREIEDNPYYDDVMETILQMEYCGGGH